GLVHYFPVIRQTCLEALLELEVGPPAMRPALKDPDPEIRYVAAKKFIAERKKEGIDALVSCFRLTRNRHRWAIYHRRLGALSGIQQRHDWDRLPADEAAKIIEGWESWWKKVRAGFKFPQEAVLHAEVLPEELDELLEECDTDELDRIEKESGQGGDPKKLTARLQKFLQTGEHLDCGVLVRAARCFTRLREFRKALDLCRRVTDEGNREKGISYNIYYDMAHFAAGEAYLGLGDKASARESLRRALLLDPDNRRFRQAREEWFAKRTK
ncbi:MAG: tetratricopeptide repeat protein, partial [Planctomycetota bacterium]